LPSIAGGGRTIDQTTTTTACSYSGHVVNLASNDVGRFVDTAVTANFILLGPLEAVVVLVMGMILVGPIAFAAGYALLLCVLVPLQFWLSRRFATCRRGIARETDARVGWISQAVYGARVMKLHGWEDLFLQRLTRQRELEMKKLYTTSRLKAWNEAIYFCASTVVASFVLCLHVAISDGQERSLTPEMVYTTLTLLNILQFTLTKHIPNAIMGLSECYVSCQRIQAFLELPNHHAQPVITTTFISTTEDTTTATEEGKKRDVVLSLDNVTCFWDNVGLDDNNDDSQAPTKMALSNVSLSFQRGRLYCVIGKIGSSKSALLQAITGELLPTTRKNNEGGVIYRNYQSMSYVAQEPWIMNGTIRDNILLGHAMNHEWYERVIDACALRLDLEQFPQRDETMVGDRGVQCSGGQRARIGLARALYYPRNVGVSKNHVLLLDDPLSAVDARVAKSIFFNAILELGVAMGKCVILVTHQHQFVGMADECILMDSGQVACTGTFEECQLASLSFNNVDCGRNGEADSHVTQIDKADDHHPYQEQRGTAVEAREDTSPPKESQEEKRETGIVKRETWASYARSFGGYPVCLAFFIVFAMTQATLLVTLVLLGKWGELPSDEQHSTKWFAMIGGTTVLLILFSVFRAQISFFILVRCSKRLHDEMAKAVLRTKISFFDTNPLGRILNRFSADVGIVDEILPRESYAVILHFLGTYDESTGTRNNSLNPSAIFR
jgi:ATP-binding cassette, subfamily C (CFTR/MRP), member 4